jgi:hypothetical protein
MSARGARAAARSPTAAAAAALRSPPPQRRAAAAAAAAATARNHRHHCPGSSLRQWAHHQHQRQQLNAAAPPVAVCTSRCTTATVSGGVPRRGFAWTPQSAAFPRRTAAELYREIRELTAPGGDYTVHNYVSVREPVRASSQGQLACPVSLPLSCTLTRRCYRWR